MDAVRKGHLPRLAREWYRGQAFVLWTLTIEDRATGWLTPSFHHHWQFTLLHSCARYLLLCPAYVLMPDHIHAFLLGTNDGGSDQIVAVEFLRKHLRDALTPADWQHQPHDRVLRQRDREQGAFLNVAGYVLDNPIRAGLVARREDYPYLGCCVPGYPDLDVQRADHWELFWRIYSKQADRDPATRSRS